MNKVKQEITIDSEDYYFCPLCMKIHEFTVPCMQMLDKQFRNKLLLEFKEINEEEVKDDRKETLSKNQMKFSDKILEEMK